MNQQQLENYLENAKRILKQEKDEVKKLYYQKEELNRRERNILTIIEDAKEILDILREKRYAIYIEQQRKRDAIEGKIRELHIKWAIQNNSLISSITELSDSRIATGDDAGYLTLFTVDYEND